MILYEFEGKELLKKAGIEVPSSVILTSPSHDVSLKYPLFLKAQVLSGNRKAAGGIVLIKDKSQLNGEVETLFKKKINNEKVDIILAEEGVEFEKEYYLSLSYDSTLRRPIVTFSEEGGSGIEERGGKIYSIDPLDPLHSLPDIVLQELLQKLVPIFFENDCLLLEINPLVKTKKGEWIALDAKVKLDDTALSSHPDWQEYPARSAPGHTPTKREIEAKKIDENDYRGVAGSAFFDLEGDIAVMASGGGASLTALDTLIKVGGKPANYTEYGGNPPKEKVVKLTKVVLDKENLNGLWVVGALANFTDIYQTLSGFIEGLREVKETTGKTIDFPIVIRRAGPRDDEARKMLNEVKDFDIHLYGEDISIAESARIMVDLADHYKKQLAQGKRKTNRVESYL